MADNLTDGIMLARLMRHETPTLATSTYSGGKWASLLRDTQRKIVEAIRAGLYGNGEVLPSRRR